MSGTEHFPEEPSEVRVRRRETLPGEVSAQLSDVQNRLLRYIGEGRSLDELKESRLIDNVSQELEKLRASGVIEYREVTVTGFDQARRRLGSTSGEEEELLQTPCDLEEWEKKRILLVKRAVERGEYFELLKLPRTATKKELKRAYFSLSKDFHPDRFHNREIGPFMGVLEKIFTSTSQFVKTLEDSRTIIKASDKRPLRRSPRFAVRLGGRLQCAEWEQSQPLVCGNISAGGLYAVAPQSARRGDGVHLVLQNPAGTPIRTQGRVVAALPHDDKQVGLCIEFVQVDELQETCIRDLLSWAKSRQPGVSDEAITPKPVRMVTGTDGARDPIIAIDFGTTNTAVAVGIGNKVQIICDKRGQYSFPSAVAFPERGRYVVGEEALEIIRKRPSLGVQSVKRLVGRHADDPEIQGYLNSASFRREKGPDGSIIANFWGEKYAILQLCSYVISAARERAEAALGQDVRRAVLTVPVSFDDEKLELMRRAAKLAHLEVEAFIQEPTAAAVANRQDTRFSGVLGVYDFGGGTFDFSLVRVSAGDVRVLTTAGDSWLGGDDFDLAMANASAELIAKVHGVDVRNRVVEWQELVHNCELAKQRLSDVRQTHMELTDLVRKKYGSENVRINLERNRVNMFWRDPVRRSLNTCKQAMALHGIAEEELSAIYLSGGTSYIPFVRSSLQATFGVPLLLGVPPGYAVCAGAGIHAAQLEHQQGTTLKTA